MPTIYVFKEQILSLLGENLTDEQFIDLCFDYGIEAEVTNSSEANVKEVESKEVKPVYKLEISANRYDLLSIEGVVMALRCYLKKDEPHTFKLNPPQSSNEKMIVERETEKVRPFIVAAILRNVHLDETSYKSFIYLQDKLHQNICRKRTLVAIGTHDYDTITPPFFYKALKPQDIKFVALREKVEMTADKLMEKYETDLNLKPYVHIIKGKEVYPVIYDSKNIVLSMPPMINGEHSKITLNTKNIFIECTATDLTRAKIALNMLLCLFSTYCAPKFSVDSFQIQYHDHTEIMPELNPIAFDVDPKYVNDVLGLNLKGEEMCDLLKKMDLISTFQNPLLKVIVPPLRADIIHPCDIVEDVAVAYGLNKINQELPPTATLGKQLPICKFVDQLRILMASAGYNECLTMALISKEDQFTLLGKKVEEDKVVSISNFLSKDNEILRISLLPGILNTLSSNKEEEMPIKIFEIGEIVLPDKTTDTGAINKKRIGILYSNLTGGFEIVHGILDYLFTKIGLMTQDNSSPYSLLEIGDESFMEKRRVQILIKEKPVGIMGVIHPSVNKKLSYVYPISYLELDVDTLFAEVFAK